MTDGADTCTPAKDNEPHSFCSVYTLLSDVAYKFVRYTPDYHVAIWCHTNNVAFIHIKHRVIERGVWVHNGTDIDVFVQGTLFVTLKKVQGLSCYRPIVGSNYRHDVLGLFDPDGGDT